MNKRSPMHRIQPACEIEFSRLTTDCGKALRWDTLEEARAVAAALRKFGVLRNLAIPVRSELTRGWVLRYPVSNLPEDDLWVSNPSI
jgi:hypothetical protein